MDIGLSLKLQKASAGLAILTLTGIAPATWAAESEVDFVKCSSAKTTSLNVGGDVTAIGMENWGIVASGASKEFENSSTHCVGFFRIIGGKRAGRGMCKMLDPAGDTVLGEFEILGPGAGSWEFVAGTGKFKGIAGSGQWKVYTTAKPSAEGTSQFCERYTGKYTLP
jgi:hypothetical protein